MDGRNEMNQDFSNVYSFIEKNRWRPDFLVSQ